MLVIERLGRVKLRRPLEVRVRREDGQVVLEAAGVLSRGETFAEAWEGLEAALGHVLSVNEDENP